MAEETESSSSIACSSATSSSIPTSDSESTISNTVSLLDRLKCPRPSELSRNRKVHCNPPPPKGKKRSSGVRGLNDPHVPPSKRLSEFPNKQLVVSAGRLFCRACREILSLKRSTIESHVKSAKHVESKKAVEQRQVREKDIAEALQRHTEVTHQKGETLPEEQRIHRVKVVQTFLRAGVPIAKLDIFRPLLEENAFRLTGTRHMLDLVPFILNEEKARIRKEIEGKFIAVIFDETSRLGEVLAVVLRFISEWTIQQRLVRLQFLVKSMNGKEIARELINILSVTLGIQSHLVLAPMRDRASVNNLAMRTVKVIYPNILDIGCFSHTLDIVREKFNTPTLNTISSLWISLFLHSPKSRALWKEQTGQAMGTP